ncbi:MAG: hypothetical protein VYA35_04225 [Pseudomonadota bacterium]|nr:hypothetical protein [Sphingobium naphthae]MEE2740571.1 hypothetical protein [Pseudomonadota bacterium]
MTGGVSRPEPERAVHYLAFANDYADAAGRILLINRADAAQMGYFALVAHGLELALKAILIADGWDEERLMLMGHSLHRCCRAIDRGSLDLAAAISASDHATIDALDCPHAMQCFRYPGLPPQDLPAPAAAHGCLRRVLAVAAQRIY